MSPGDGAADPGSLADLIATLAADLPEATTVPAGGRTEWRRGSVPFASLDSQGVELRLDPAIAAAALRTPDTTPSTRGLPWIRFAPEVLDGHAIDRATAWFGLAYRRAADA